jgi:preprotein translocase subunit SecA
MKATLETSAPAAHLETLAAVAALEPELAAAGDGELTLRARTLRHRARDGAPLEGLLPECFALVRESARRVLGQRPYDVQMLAGIALAGAVLTGAAPAAGAGGPPSGERGTVVEMQTGEGKTLAAVAPAALYALTGRGVHVLTYNDYLARRDAGWMGPVYERLGLTAGFVEEGLTPRERQRAYGADVTYLTVQEAGFDLLRDGLCLDPAQQVHRPFHFALVDEADSLLIDEARIPLVLAGHVDEPEVDLPRLAKIARCLSRGLDFATDADGRNLFLTDRGVRRAEAMLGCGNLYAASNVRLQAELRNALHAEALLHRDVDYIVRGGRIELVDELTGRVAENRCWPDGLQAALEAKEGLGVQPDGTILASITIQHFLQKYPRLAGMTATARPAARELAEVYGLGVLPLPTHRPSIRRDEPDVIFPRREAKRRAVVEEIARVHAAGRPILVGTVSVGESEDLAAELARAGIPCRVLNAKNDVEEAQIVAEAGALGAVTISTNMAGRGTDIRLGGSDEAQREAVVALGGLYVLGTHRHESRRIDDQLRGRAGRQGDPGASRFFLSLEDDLMRRYGIADLLPAKLLRGLDTAAPVDHPAVAREVARVQRIAEGQHGDIRRRLLSTAGLLERQYGELRSWRQEVLEGRGGASLLAEASRERWARLAEACGEELLRGIERRLTLLAIDRGWSEHLSEMQALRDEIHLVELDGRDPVTEFFRTAQTAFEELLSRIDTEIVATFERIEITARGVDWEREGLTGPSSTWTYLVHDHVFGGNTFLTLSNRASFGFMGVLLLWPVLLLWGLGEHLRRWWRRRVGRQEG